MRIGAVGAFRDEDDGVQLHAVAHGDHRLASHIIVRFEKGIGVDAAAEHSKCTCSELACSNPCQAALTVPEH